MNLLNTAVTMSSLELVEMINSSRKPSEPELLHYNFLAKVNVVLGLGDALKFKGIYKDSGNRTKPCYYFPKREACLMAMSYSYELQARVFDRMTELEARAVQVKTSPVNESLDAAARAAEVAPVFIEAAKAFGLDQNAATLSVNQYLIKQTGVNLLEALGQKALVAPNQKDLYFTPTELGQLLPGALSGIKVNRLLADAGLQARINDRWVPTDTGRKYSRVFDTSKRHNIGVPIQQIKWANSVLTEIDFN